MPRSNVKKRLRLRKEEIARQHTTPSLQRAFVELSEDYKWIEVWFPYTYLLKEAVAGISGAHFKDKYQGGPKWRVPRDLQTCNDLREIFGPTKFVDDYENDKRIHIAGLHIGDALRSWSSQQLSIERNLSELTNAKDAKLKRIKKDSRIWRCIAGEPITELELPPLPSGHPHPLMIEREPRPYQRADIRIMAVANVMNANMPGVGKTIETIGSWVESDAIDSGPILVIGPVKSLENTWLKEIIRWLGDRDDVAVFTDENPLYRARQVEAFLEAYEDSELEGPTILCVNYEWFRLVMTHKKGTPILAGIERCIKMKLSARELQVDLNGSSMERNQEQKLRQIAALEALGIDCEENWAEEDRLDALAKTVEARHDHKGNIYGYANPLQRRLFDVAWSAATVDEFHKSGLNNRLSLFALGLDLVKADLKSALSGTPMGGKPRKLWKPFNWLDPEEFPSEWRWVNRWLKTETGHTAHSKIVGGLQDEEAFGKAHAKNMIRRTKLSALPGLPPRVEQVIWSKMSATQKKQYDQFQNELEIKIDEERLSATNILTMYMRLKQFANAKQRIVDGVPYPTEDSGKLDDVLQILDENGIRKEDPEPGLRAIIGSESSRMVFMINEWLRKKGIPSETLTGDTKDSKPILARFKSNNQEPFVIVMTIQTGGVSLDLEEACCMLQVDETWNPDETEQFFERGDRGTRTEALNCYIFRTSNTIQEYVAEVNEGKKVTNDTVLKIRQRIHDADDMSSKK